MAKRVKMRAKRPKQWWSAFRAYLQILQQHGPNSSAEREFWRTRLLGNVLSAKLAARLVGSWKLFNAEGQTQPTPHSGEAQEAGSFDAIFAAAEPYRGKNVLLAVSNDNKPPEVLAADADVKKVKLTADATGRKYLVVFSPPAKDAAVFVPTFT